MKKMSSVETIIEQVVMGTYKNGEDKILYKTLPQSMIEHCLKLHKEEIIKAWQKGDGQFDKVSDKMSLEYYNEIYGGSNEQG
jgi:hypothetical protein